MDQELLDLIARLAASTEENPPAGTEPLSDDELSDLRTRVTTRLSQIDRANPSADDIVVAREGRAVLAAVAAEEERRQTEREGRAAELAAELEGLELPDPPAETTPPEGEAPEGETPPAGDGGDGGEPGEPGEPGEVPATTAEGETPPEGQTPEQIAAAAAPVRPLSITRLAARAPSRTRPQPTATDSQLPSAGRSLVAAGIPGLATGADIEPHQFFDGLVRKWNATRDMNPGDGTEMVYLASARHTYPEERFLDDSDVGNEEKLTAAVTVDASLLASGGVCGPVAVDYNLSTIASAVRPVQRGLVQFGASRGGLRYVRPHTLAAVHTDGPNTIWTQATDAAPGNSTKGLATYVCNTPVEDYVDAIVSQTKLGNFQARYFPEQVDQYLTTADADHARLAEGTLLGQMLTGSTLLNSGTNGTGNTGAASEYLAELDRAVAAYRWRHRMDPDSALQLFYPEWFEDTMRADLARELPGNSGTGHERLAVADAYLDTFFTTRNLVVTTYLDNPTGASVAQGWTAPQKAGDLEPWPTKVLSFLFHPGAWVFLDGGELNLGMIRDSVLAKTNDLVMFKETFEKAIFRGHESWAIMFDFCANGSRAATVDTSGLCSSGS